MLPAGIEYQPFAELYTDPGKNPQGLQQNLAWATLECAVNLDYSSNILANPPFYGYPLLPPNWESAAQLAANKPTTQTARQAVRLACSQSALMADVRWDTRPLWARGEMLAVRASLSRRSWSSYLELQRFRGPSHARPLTARERRFAFTGGVALHAPEQTAVRMPFLRTAGPSNMTASYAA